MHEDIYRITKENILNKRTLTEHIQRPTMENHENRTSRDDWTSRQNRKIERNLNGINAKLRKSNGTKAQRPRSLPSEYKDKQLMTATEQIYSTHYVERTIVLLRYSNRLCQKRSRIVFKFIWICLLKKLNQLFSVLWQIGFC